jgi:hypothetical protein
MMIELKQELEALANQWHNGIDSGTMTNKEYAEQLRNIIVNYDFDYIFDLELDPELGKKWTELETAFLREQSNRGFKKWLKGRQDTSKQTS